ncbi:MAG: hypothetical protein ABI877_15155, partial [Gemmatimonadaceae bacterium]
GVMIDALAVAALGFFLGMRHATDPDHVVAVTTIVARHRSVKGAALVGAVWGLGHTITLLIVGGGIVLFGWVIPPRLGLSLELSVGLMLIALGAMNLAAFMKRLPDGASSVTPSGDHGHEHVEPPAHAHAHPHGDYVHTHAHLHDPERHPHDPARTPLSWLDRHLGALRGYQLVRPLVVGIVHGLAGSAAVALLVLATIPDPTWAVLYLGVFGVGTIAGMMLVTAVLGIPFASGGRRTPLHRGIRLASGAISLCFGLFIAYQVGVVQGLFTGTPHWTPK